MAVGGDLVHVQQGAQIGRARLAAHPRHELGQDQAQRELALLVGEMSESDDRRAGLAIRVQDGVDVDGHALCPCRERRRRQQAVELHRQLHAVLGRIERVELEHTELAHRRVRDHPDERRQVEVLALLPALVDEVGEQDVLARRQRVGVDADEAEQTGHEAFYLVTDDLGIGAIGWRLQRPDEVERDAHRRARRVDGEARRVAQRRDVGAGQAPTAQAVGPGLGLRGREVVERLVGLLGVGLVDPRPEVARRQVRERQAEVGQVPLRVDQQAGDASAQHLLDEHDAESRLARARHADDDTVRREVGGGQRHRRPIASVLRRIDVFAEEEFCHGGPRYAPRLAPHGNAVG